jgi:hypothetical protein
MSHYLEQMNGEVGKKLKEERSLFKPQKKLAMLANKQSDFEPCFASLEIY